MRSTLSNSDAVTRRVLAMTASPPMSSCVPFHFHSLRLTQPLAAAGHAALGELGAHISDPPSPSHPHLAIAPAEQPCYRLLASYVLSIPNLLRIPITPPHICLCREQARYLHQHSPPIWPTIAPPTIAPSTPASPRHTSPMCKSISTASHIQQHERRRSATRNFAG